MYLASATDFREFGGNVVFGVFWVIVSNILGRLGKNGYFSPVGFVK